MDRRSIILVVVLFALIVLGMFTFAYLKKSETTDSKVIVTPEVALPYPDVTRIDAKHFYQSGLHTFVGELELPTPCDLLDVTSTVMESYPEQVRLDFVVINNAEGCIDQVTTQKFSVEARASEAASVSATFMGRAIDLNLIPAAKGETPEDFELFIKG